jgi:hypothetical protein
VCSVQTSNAGCVEHGRCICAHTVMNAHVVVLIWHSPVHICAGMVMFCALAQAQLDAVVGLKYDWSSLVEAG